MVDRPTRAADLSGPGPEAAAAPPWLAVPAGHETPARPGDFSWLFTGSHAMPYAEHLIPFRN